MSSVSSSCSLSSGSSDRLGGACVATSEEYDEEYNYSNDEDECPHAYVSGSDQMVCEDCGVVVSNKLSLDPEWRYYGKGDNRHSNDPSRCQFVRNNEKSIYNYTIDMDIPDDIVQCANDIYRKILKHNVKRSTNKMSIVFSCIFIAYKMNNKVKSLEELNKFFNLKRREISKGFKLVNIWMKKLGIHADKMAYITPEHIIPTLVSKLKCAEEGDTEKCIDFYRKISKYKTRSLIGSTSYSISCGVVFYFFNHVVHRYIKIDEIVRAANLSKITVTKVSNDIDFVVKKYVK